MDISNKFKRLYSAKNEAEKFSIEEYLALCKKDPSVYSSPAERLLKAIGDPERVDTSKDSRLSKIFMNRVINIYPAFKGFFGAEEAIERIVSYLKHSAQGLEESKQILYLLGPVGGGKSSLAEQLKTLMEREPIYVIEGSPVFDDPLSIFYSPELREDVIKQYKVPARAFRSIPSPWLVQRLEEIDWDLSKLNVLKVYPDILKQVAVAKVEPGDENNQDISSLVGKVDIRKLEDYSQNHPYAYSYSGGLCRANRGLLDFVEMFKAPIKMLHPLLTATQERNYNGTEAISAMPFDGIILAHCFSEDTEILTENGWRGIDQIEIGDSIATLNKENRSIEYQPAVDKFVYDYDGPINHFSSSCFDHLVTDDHKMVYEMDNTANPVIVQTTAKELADKIGRTSRRVFYVSGKVDKPDWDLYSDDEIRFLIQLVTDGNVYNIKKNGIKTIRFHFKKQRKIDRIETILSKLGYEYKRIDQDSSGTTKFLVYNVTEKFTKFLNESHRNFSPRQVDIILKEWSITDGSSGGNRKDSVQLYTNVPFHRDLIQELCAVSGHKSTYSTNQVDRYSLGYTLSVMIGKEKVVCSDFFAGTKDYDGRVWCLETENHTLVARRNGKVVITGNSNDSEWQTFRNNKNNEAFLDRVNLIKVPYCLRVDEEVSIYEKLLSGSTLFDAPCAPQTLEMLAKFCVLSRLYDPENSNIFSKMRVYNGENIKDTDPKAKPLQEYKDDAGVTEGMGGISTRFAFKVLSKVFNYDSDEVGANPIYLMYVLENEIINEQFPKEKEELLISYIKGYLKDKYLEFIDKELRIAFLESYGDYGQNLFEKYCQWADAWISDTDYRDPTTNQMYNHSVLNQELEKIEKPAGIANPKDFRNEVVNFVLRFRANNGGNTPRWNSFEKIREVIEKRMFASTEDILPVISFDTPKGNEEEKSKHDAFVERMGSMGYTPRMTKLLVDWWNRVKKNG